MPGGRGPSASDAQLPASSAAAGQTDAAGSVGRRGLHVRSTFLWWLLRPSPVTRAADFRPESHRRSPAPEQGAWPREAGLGCCVLVRLMRAPGVAGPSCCPHASGGGTVVLGSEQCVMTCLDPRVFHRGFGVLSSKS